MWKNFKIEWNFKNGKYLIKIDLYGKFYDFVLCVRNFKDLFISVKRIILIDTEKIL